MANKKGQPAGWPFTEVESAVFDQSSYLLTQFDYGIDAIAMISNYLFSGGAEGNQACF